ncbi:unnamed protein product, partial [Rotaria magnacalcarata]
MSTISYNNNQVPLQPPPQQRQQGRRRGGVLGGNNYNYNYPNYPINRKYPNQYPNQYPNGNFYRRQNTFYNRNHQNYQPQRRFNGYGVMNQPYIPPFQIPQQRRMYPNQGRIGRPTRARSGSNQNQRRSQSRQPQQQQQQRRRRPRQLRLNDFMPTELREPSPTAPNLPQEFNLGANTAPPDALPQRQVFANAATTANNNNTTQPFMVNQNNNQQQVATTTTTTTSSSYRRQQRRGGQQQNQQNRRNHRNRRNSNYNRFAELAEENDNDDDPVEIDAPIVTTNQNNKKNKITKKNKTRLYLEPTRMLRWFEDNSKNSKNSASGRGNQAYILATAPIYDEWVRNNYELQVWQTYLKMGTEQKHWAKEIIQRTKKRDDTTNSRFINKKINQLMASIAQASATISKLQMELNTYWMQNSAEIITQKQAHTTAELTTNLVLEKTGLGSTLSKNTVPASTITTTTAGLTTIKSVYRDPVDRLEKHILDYIHHCTQHVKKVAETRIQLAKAQMDEFKALEDFEQIATPSQWNIHLMLKPKVKLCSTKAKNYVLATKRAEYDLPPKFVSKIDFTFKIDQSIVNKDEMQATYDEMRQITKDFRTQAMKLYVQSLAREHELLSNEIKRIIEGFPKKEKKKKRDDDSNAEASSEASFDAEAGFDTEAGFAAFKQYHQLPSRVRAKQSRTCCRPDSHSITGRGFLAPAIMNQANIKLTEQEHQLLKLGPRFIFDDPKTASRRRTTELATLKRKIETRFFEKKVRPGRPVEQFIAELDILLQNLHNIPATKKRIPSNKTQTNKSFDTLSSIIQSSQSSQSQTIIRPRKKKNYGRIVKRLKYKIHLANTILRKTDKSKVFHLGKVDHYQKKSEEYMDNTKAYQCLGTIDPLPDLIQRTNRYLLDLRLAKWITQKQYEQLSIKSNEVELAHLYYLPKAHKPGTPLRPIISGLKHPTIKISKFLDDLLRPL